MDNKIKLIATASLVAVLVSGCSNNRGTSTGGNVDYASGQRSSGGLFSQRRPAPVSTCGACAAAAASAKPQKDYVYKPAPKTQAKPAGKYDQKYYVEKWKREQAQGGSNYAGYGSGNYNANVSDSNTNYYDYTSTGKNTTSNKSIYTGSYQQKNYKPYQPTTYAGGGAATTATSSNSSYYTVKKGDTVFEIMRQTGVYWKDIIKMNNLVAPAYNINPGQRIRLK